MNHNELISIIDAEYDVIKDMDKKDRINYLIESFEASKKSAERALANFGLI